MNIIRKIMGTGSFVRNMRMAVFFVFVIVTLISAEPVQAAFTCGIDTVSAGGHTYTTKIGADGKCWTNQNMRHGADHYACGGNAYYRVSIRNSANSACSALGSGWHVPVSTEWQALLAGGPRPWTDANLVAVAGSLDGSYYISTGPGTCNGVGANGLWLWGDSDWYVTWLTGGVAHLNWSAGGKMTFGTYVSLMCITDYVAPAPVNGVCSATHYACTAGTSANNVSGTTSYTWNCNGTNGGTNATCSEAKPTGTVAVSSNIAASWTITGPVTISGSGTAQTSLAQPVGTYTITWGAVPGYTTPASSTLTLTNGGTISFNGAYISSAVCTGTLPANATTYAGDDTGLSANTARSYSASNTLPKCQYSCNGGYSWNGSACVAPTYSCTGSIPGNASMFPNDNVGLSIDTPYTYWPFDTGTRCQYSCNAGYDFIAGACVLLPTPTLQICRDGAPIVQGGGTYGFLLSTGDTTDIKVYYDSNVTSGNQCDAGSTDVTASATFTETNSSGGALSLSAIGTNPRVFTGAFSGTETVIVTHSGQTATMSATVSCTETVNCTTEKSAVCTGSTVPSGTTKAGVCGTVDCSGEQGTRYCDFNWKEVAPGQ